MQKNLSGFAGCVLAFGISGACLAGEGPASTQALRAQAVEAQAVVATAPRLTGYPGAGWLGGNGSEDNTLLTSLLGLGLLATVVYRAQARS